MEAMKTRNNELDNAMQVVFSMLDEAIDDIENDDLLSEEEFWKGIRENS